jgi:hypothetical protein
LGGGVPLPEDVDVGLRLRAGGWISIAAAVEFAGYALVVLFVTQVFAIAVLNYLPAAAFLVLERPLVRKGRSDGVRRPC